MWDPQERWGSGSVRPLRMPLNLPSQELASGGADGTYALPNIWSAHSRSAGADATSAAPNWKLHDVGTGPSLESWLRAVLREMWPV